MSIKTLFQKIRNKFIFQFLNQFMNFYLKVYNLVSKIPKGKVSTYGNIAKSLNSKAYRAVGTAMNKNPFSIKKKNQIYVPCHRVINSDGRVGGFASGTKKKIEMLKAEGVEIKNGKIDTKKYGFKF